MAVPVCLKRLAPLYSGRDPWWHFLFREISIHASLLLVLAIVFVATVIRSAFGFGEALIAVPLLVLCTPLRVAAPLAVLLSIAIAAMVVAQDWRHVHLRSAAGLLLATVFGIPLGLLVLTNGHQELVKAGLGILIALFAVFSLAARDALRLKNEHRALLLLSGFLAGILGGAYGMNGPPLVIYGSLRGWSPQHFRATLQAYFLPASILGMIGFSSNCAMRASISASFFTSISGSSTTAGRSGDEAPLTPASDAIAV